MRVRVCRVLRGRASLQTPGLEKRIGCSKGDPFLHLSSMGKYSCPGAPILTLEVVNLVCFLKQIHTGDKCMYVVILTTAEQDETYNCGPSTGETEAGRSHTQGLATSSLKPNQTNAAFFTRCLWL